MRDVLDSKDSIPGELEQDERWKLVQRILRSPQFQKAVRLRDFLTYVTVETLQGQLDKVSEQHIGCRVFDRQQGYNSAEDNTVRVHARQLRARLEEYFLTEGRNEPLVLAIPKGSYVPVFQSRVVNQIATALETLPQEPQPDLPPRVSMKVVSGAMVLLGLLSAVLAWQNWKLRQAVVESTGSPMPWMLAAVLDPVETTTVVIADSGFGALRSRIKAGEPLAQYTEPGFPKGLIVPGTSSSEESWIRSMTSRPYTSFANLLVATQLARLAERTHSRVSFRFAREMNPRDFSEGRFILLGSAIVNPWVSLFESQQSFPSGWDPVNVRSLFRNVSPRPGERDVYMPNAPNAAPGEAFGQVCLLLDHKTSAQNGTSVLLIEGTNIESSEAAATFLFDSRMSQDALRAAAGTIPPKGGAASRYRFEAILRTMAVSGASRGTEVVATRYSVDK